MPRLVILPAARADLIEIGDFIALDNPERAASFVTEIETRLNDVAARPGSFPARDEVRIVRVLHGARDLPAALG